MIPPSIKTIFQKKSRKRRRKKEKNRRRMEAMSCYECERLCKIGWYCGTPCITDDRSS